MPEPKLRFSFSEPDIDTQRPVVDGTVKIEGFELEVVPKGAPAPDWDVRDHVSVGRLCGSVQGDGLAYQQGLTAHRVDYHTLFHPEAAALPGR